MSASNPTGSPAGRVGLDIRILQESGAGRGIATYLRGLLDGFERAGLGDRVVRFRYPSPPPRGPVPAESRWQPLRRRWRETRGVADAVNQLMLPAEVAASGVALYHAPSPYDLAAWIPRPLVVTVHDVAPLGEDRAVLRTGLEHALLYRFVRRARRIITVSQFSRDEIVRHLGVDAARVRVIHEAPQPGLVARVPDAARAIRAELEIRTPYLLHVGGYDRIEPRKDLPTLLDAFAVLAARRPDLTLVLAGGGGAGEGELASALAVRGIADRVVRTGFVPVERMGAVYAGAACFVLPSRYEGFGLPLLEAMSMGAPCVAADAASLPEVGGDAVRYFPAGDVAEATAAVDAILDDAAGARELGERGRARAATFDWERTARETFDVYEEVLGA